MVLENAIIILMKAIYQVILYCTISLIDKVYVQQRCKLYAGDLCNILILKNMFFNVFLDIIIEEGRSLFYSSSEIFTAF